VVAFIVCAALTDVRDIVAACEAIRAADGAGRGALRRAAVGPVLSRELATRVARSLSCGDALAVSHQSSACFQCLTDRPDDADGGQFALGWRDPPNLSHAHARRGATINATLATPGIGGSAHDINVQQNRWWRRGRGRGRGG
jgi:hypothetical protein